MRKILLAIFTLVLFVSTNTYSQNNTSSPYSRLGLGELFNGGNAKSVGMGGASLTYKDYGYINSYNPASLSGLDSMRFIFNIGLSSKYTQLEQTNDKDSFHDNNFTHLSFGCRASKHYSFAFIVQPYSNIGYEISQVQLIDNTVVQYSYKGTGGLNQLVFSNAVNITDNLALGVNGMFMFGTSNSIETVGVGTNYNSDESKYSTTGLYANFGLQFSQPINSKLKLNLAGTYQPKQSMRVKEKNEIISSGITVKDRTMGHVNFDVPESFGAGLGFSTKQVWVGMDYNKEMWKDAKHFFQRKTTNHQYIDRDRYSIGVNYNPNVDGFATSFFKKLSYRFGAFYDTGYVRVNGEDITDKAISLGLGIPMSKGKGQINVALEFGQRGTLDNYNIREDYAKLSLQFSLFEAWFVKRKYK
ncbi:MAG: hypothetical protein N4A49_01485 [Marinifilaceae bacterium]|jgi:hypothetical protein|nr:hypothetical protein [Marinifilaceae bacterium]